MIQLLKYRAHALVAVPLGRLLWETYRQFWLPAEIDVIVPVPLHSSCLRERGFNQAALLLREWSTREQDGGESLPELAFDLMIRSRPTNPQTGLDRLRRISNLRGAFTISRGAAVR